MMKEGSMCINEFVQAIPFHPYTEYIDILWNFNRHLEK